MSDTDTNTDETHESTAAETDPAAETPTPDADNPPLHTTESGYPGDDAPDRGRGEPKRIELDAPEGIGVYHRIRHRGGDQTLVLLLNSNGGWQALALDVGPDGETLATETIGHAESEDRATCVCEYWLQTNPGGILGESDDAGLGGGSDGGLLSNFDLGGLFGGGGT
jgi:hypothetical protein